MDTATRRGERRHRSHHHHGGRKHGQERRTETRKLIQRLAILSFILFTLLAFFYIWASSESNDATSSGAGQVSQMLHV